MQLKEGTAMTTTAYVAKESELPHSVSAGGGRSIVVGVDESSCSADAVEWAAHEAALRAVPLVLVHSWAWQRLSPWTAATDHTVINDFKRAGQRVVEEARNQAERLHPGLLVSTTVTEGTPSDVLTELGTDATMIVLGSRHRLSFDRAVLGSVTNAMVARATCPVVVLGAPAGLPAERPSIVAGVAGTEQDSAVLAFAFDEAQRRGRPLKPVLCWHSFFEDEQLPLPKLAHLQLAESLAGWREQFPDVEVHPSVVRAHPAHALVAAAASQELLVVGRRAQRVRFGHLMGSVSLAVLHHVTCPVAVVPSD
jgi:nucleotide-binding universal stress UspA family protein